METSQDLINDSIDSYMRDLPENEVLLKSLDSLIGIDLIVFKKQGITMEDYRRHVINRKRETLDELNTMNFFSKFFSPKGDSLRNEILVFDYLLNSLNKKKC